MRMFIDNVPSQKVEPITDIKYRFFINFIGNRGYSKTWTHIQNSVDVKILHITKSRYEIPFPFRFKIWLKLWNYQYWEYSNIGVLKNIDLYRTIWKHWPNTNFEIILLENVATIIKILNMGRYLYMDLYENIGRYISPQSQTKFGNNMCITKILAISVDFFKS